MIFNWVDHGINSISNEKVIGVISRKQFLEVHQELPSNLAIISILDPKIEPFDIDILGKFDRFGTFHFDDVEEDFCNYRLISDEVAERLRNFILDNKDRQFLVHCMAGQSRSAGVAKAIECLCFFDGDVFAYRTSFDSDIGKNKRYFPNLAVFDKVCGRDKND